MENKVVTQAYFNKLNYTLANEDTTFEYEFLQEGLGHIVSVAGSGGRVVPLLAKKPKRLTCVDVSAEQLYLTELRLEACRQLSYEDFLILLGYNEELNNEKRRAIFAGLRMSEACKIYLTKVFESLEYGSLLYEGKWEKTFTKIAKLNHLITGEKGREIFRCKTLIEQNEYFIDIFPRARFWTLIFLVGNRAFFNALLYKGHFAKKNIPMGYYKFYHQAFEKLFTSSLLRENFFMNILFFGEVKYKNAWPIETREDVFHEAKEALQKTRVEYVQGDLLQTVPKLDEGEKLNIDFIGLSDVPSYFSGETEHNFMQVLRPTLAEGGHIIVRNYLRIPFRNDLRGFENVTPQYASLINKEKTAMYFIDIFKKLY